MVVDTHFHGAVAQPQLAGPVADFPMGLEVRVQAGSGVFLVTAQLTFHAQLVTAEILVAAAVVLALVVIGADGEGEIAGHIRDRLYPAQGAAVELTIKVHNPAATLAVRGHRSGDGQILHHAAPPRIQVELQRGIAKVALVVHA
ncbi:hypothetical protein D3C81_1392390 [compost metagenome]